MINGVYEMRYPTYNRQVIVFYVSVNLEEISHTLYPVEL
jgi:hypothetical protein